MYSWDFSPIGPEKQKVSRLFWTDSIACITCHYSGLDSLRYSAENGRHSFVRNAPRPTMYDIWHDEGDVNSPRSHEARDLIEDIEMRNLPLRSIARYIPKLMFAVSHPAEERRGLQPLLVFSISPAKARLSEPGWLVEEYAGQPNTSAENALVNAFMSLIETDQREIPSSQDFLAYYDILWPKVLARIDALQQCVDCQRRPSIAPLLWHSMRALAQRYEQNFAET